MLRNGVGKIAWNAVIVTIVFYFAVVATAKNAEIITEKNREYSHQNIDGSSTLDSNFDAGSKKDFQTESVLQSDLSSGKHNGKASRSSVLTKAVIFKVNRKRQIKYNNRVNPARLTTLDSGLDTRRDNHVQNDEDEAESDSNDETYADGKDETPKDFYSKDEEFHLNRANSVNSDDQSQNSVTDLYSDSELSGEFEQNDEVESSSTNEVTNKKEAHQSSFPTRKKTNKHLQINNDNKKLRKKPKKTFIRKKDSGNSAHVVKTRVKVKEHTHPTQLVAVKQQPNTERPILANYKNNREQDVQSHHDQNTNHGLEIIPAAIDMAFQKPSSSVSIPSRPSQPYSKPTQVYSRMSQPPPTSSQTYTNPTQKYTKSSHKFSSPTQPRTRPTQTYTTPTVTLTKPAKTHANPKKLYKTPTQTVKKPSKTHVKPKKLHQKPTQTLAKPSKIYTKPKDLYATPTQTAKEPSTIYTKPKDLYATPTQTAKEPSKTHVKPKKLHKRPTQPLTKPTQPQSQQIHTRPRYAVFPQATPWLYRHLSQQAPAKPTPSQSCKSAIDLAFLMEGSRSISQTGYKNYLFLRDFVKKISLRMVVSPKNIRIGLITFASRPYLHLGLFGGSAIGSVLDVLNRPPPRYHSESSARAGRALDFVRRQLFGCYCDTKSTRKKVVVLITDGKSSDRVNWSARKLKKSGIQIVCVGIGRYFDIYQLNSMASRPYTENVFTGSFIQIHHVIDELVKQICKVSDGTLVPSKHSCPCN